MATVVVITNPVNHYLAVLVVIAVVASIVGLVLYKAKYDTPQRRLNQRWARQEKEQKREREARETNEKKLNDIRQQADPIAGLSGTPIDGAVEVRLQSWEEFPIGQKVGWEVTKLVDQQGKKRRITIVKGQVMIKADRYGRPPKFLFLKVKRAGRNNYYFVDPQRLLLMPKIQGKKGEMEYKVVFHEFIAEAMKADGNTEWSPELEMILADSGLDQYVEIASSDLGFKLTPTLRNTMIIIAFLGLLVGFAVNGTYHFEPQTVIHWIP